MSEQARSRFAVDLDELERQLRTTASTQPKAPAADPLAELARIVGQDDPFKAIFAEKPADRTVVAPRPAPQATVDGDSTPRRVEPSLDDLLRDLTVRPAPPVGEGFQRQEPPAMEVTAERPVSAQASGDPLDDFDRMLRAELRGGVAAEPQPAPAMETTIVAERAPAIEAPRDLDVRDLDARDPDMRPLSARDLDDLPGRIRAEELPPPPGPSDYPDPPAEPVEDMRSLEPQQPRKGLVIAGALLGVAALGIGAVVGLRGIGGKVPSGEPPVIRAEAGPNRVQPQNPGGVEIPNQNKAIYERTPETRPADTRVVNREEQPVDVQAAARQVSRVILPATNGQGTPAAAPPAADSTPVSPAPTAAIAPTAPQNGLGEPRRVRTVSVRPDGTIAPPPGTPPQALPNITVAGPTPAASPAPAAAPQAPRTVAAVPQPPRPPFAQAPAPTQPAAPAAPPALRPQVAAAPPAQPTPRAESVAPGGGFMVQLGAPGSESEARSTFASLQRRFPDQLSGEQPTIRRAEVAGGRQVYRLRVGPFSREDAAEKCQAIQSAGGQCFVARN